MLRTYAITDTVAVPTITNNTFSESQRVIAAHYEAGYDMPSPPFLQYGISHTKLLLPSLTYLEVTFALRA
jgi:hypothetical protein